VNAAKEWPIDTGFISKLIGLISLPTIARALFEFAKSYITL